MTNELDKELFIFGEPIETEVGLVRFLTYKEYLLNMQSISMISLNALHIYYQYRKMLDSKDVETMAELEEIKKDSLFNTVRANRNFAEAYIKVFALVLDMNDEDTVMDTIGQIFDDEELFMMIRELVMNMNMLTEDEVNENEEVQAFIEKARRAKQKDGEKQTFSDIISSVVVGSSHSFSEVASMTVLQLYSTFYRISQFQNYSTSTLFATVAEKVSIESWAKHVDLFKTETTGISSKEFNSTYGGMFK